MSPRLQREPEHARGAPGAGRKQQGPPSRQGVTTAGDERAAAPLVSIIIDNYNYGRFLATAIESALQQTYTPCEVLVVDDGSTDDSRAVIAAAGTRVTAIFKPNGGQASAFNAGFTQSHGAIVLFLDADDILLPETVTHVVAAFHAHPSLVRVQYRMAVVDRHGRPTGRTKPSWDQPLPDGDLGPYVLSAPFDLTWMATSGNAFATPALRRILPIPEANFVILADFYLVHLTSLLGPVKSLDEIGACYRVHGANQYEPATVGLDLAHLRRTIIYAAPTHTAIKALADELHLAGRPRRAGELAAVSLLAARLISLKLDPAQHPFPRDRVGRIVWRGIRASARRRDVHLPLKAVFILWFLVTGPAPRPLARLLGAKFMYPETRPGWHRILAGLHRRRGNHDSTTSTPRTTHALPVENEAG
ncbi:MAG TPA: glycosyltransferase family 2 protein [Chloroflexia bacterium]